jgi:hypothetical protein
LEATLLYTVSYLFKEKFKGRRLTTCHVALKAITAAIYTNFETEIVDDGGPGAMEQEDAVVAGPIGDKLLLRFHPVSSEELEV